MAILRAIVLAGVRPLLACILLVALRPSAFGSVSVKQSTTKSGMVDVAIVGEPLSVAAAALQRYLSRPVEVAMTRDPIVTFKARGVAADVALGALALSGNARLSADADRFLIHEIGPTVTLDVKDEDVRMILKSLKQQCGIRNLVIDPQVQGSGTFLFRDVPCRTALDMVFRVTGLRAVNYPNSVVTVAPRR